MNSDVKKIWLDALRSGNYTKGEGRLYNRDADGNECFCALGVLAEEAAKAGVIEIDPEARDNSRFPDPPTFSYLDETILQWVGLNVDSPVQAQVVRKNDSNGGEDTSTFAEVADFIEEVL